VQISAEEQLQRFESRANTPYKSWKLTAEDWRNRNKWDQYEAAVDEMLLKTSTVSAPWTIVEGNNKWWARIKTLSTVVDKLSHELHFEPTLPGVKKKK
jgi:polyphosphate kinase 2 (PPK2 family)